MTIPPVSYKCEKKRAAGIDNFAAINKKKFEGTIGTLHFHGTNNRSYMT
jgi:hypothetical protein